MKKKNIKRPKVINLFAGPGTGKSGLTGELFGKLKSEGINAEIVLEYAKDQVWQKGYRVLDNQIYVFAKQFHRMWRCEDQVDVIITDAPLLHSIIYAQGETKTFEKLVKEKFNMFDNINVFLNRDESNYSEVGRYHDLNQAKEIDQKIRKLVEPFGIHIEVNMRPGVVDELLETVKCFL